MKQLTSLRPKKFAVSFLYILNPYTITLSAFSRGFSEFCIGLHFAQLFSYVFKLEGLIFSDSRAIIFSNLFFYSNFVNFLSLVQSDSLTYIVYFGSFLVIFLFYCYWVTVTILQHTHKNWIFKLKIMTFLHIFFSRLLSIYYWVLLTPLLELFIKILNNNWPIYLLNPGIAALLYLISILGLIMSVFLIFFLFWLNRNNAFLDKDYLRLSPSFLLFVVLILRIILILTFDYLKVGALGNIVYFLLLAIGILRFLDYCLNFPLIHETFGQIYLILLSLFIVFTSYFTYLGIANSICESNDLYQLAFVSVLISKVAEKLHENMYNSILANTNEKDTTRTINFVEEFYRFFLSKASNEENSFRFDGILRAHRNECKFKECALSTIKSTDFSRLIPETQEIVIKRLLGEFFMNRIKSKENKEHSSHKNNFGLMESLLIKYVSFSAHYNFTNLKAFYEIQNILTVNKSSRSFYFSYITQGILKGIQAELQIESDDIAEINIDLKEIPLKSFFKMVREKNMFQKKMGALLAKRHAFWEKYKEGFQSYEAVIRKSYGLIDEIISFNDLLNRKLKMSAKGESNQSLIFALKFYSIFSCVVVNNINEGVKFEDRLEKIMKRELTLEKNILNCHSFFNDKLVTLQASFLHLDGRLMESSKTTKLANFFKYSPEELRNIKNIKPLMPKFMQEIHSEIVSKYINDTKNKKRKIVESFAVDKDGFIFPVKLYLKQNFQRLDDMIFESAILNVGFETEQICIVDNNGFLQGASKGFLDVFQKAQNVETALEINEMIGKLNLFCLINGLEDIFRENIDMSDQVKGIKRLKNTVMRNQNCVIKLPISLHVILDILKEKIKEETSGSHHTSRSHLSNKSKTSAMNSKTSKFLSVFFSTLGNLDSRAKSEMEQKYLKKQLTGIEVLKKIMENQRCLTYRMYFSLNFSVLKSKNHELIYASLLITKMSKWDESNFQINNDALEVSDMKEEADLNMPYENQASFPKKFTNSVVSNYEEDKSNGLSEQMRNMVLKDNHKSSKQQDMVSSQKYEEDHNNNRLFTTEADQEQGFLSDPRHIQNLEAPRMTKQQTLHLSQDRIKQITKKDSVSESLESEELKQNQQLKGKTSLEKIYDVVDRSSQTSSLSSLKKTFSIFNMIHMIQGLMPNNIRNFGWLQVVELIAIFVYCIVIYESSLMFVTKYYDPLENSLENYANIFTCYSRAVLFGLDLLLMKQGFLDANGFQSYSTIYKNVFDVDFEQMQNRINNERSKASNFDFQTYILKTPMTVIDYDQNRVISTLFLEFLGKTTTYLYSIKEDDLTDVRFEKIYYLSTNFPAFNDFYTEISNEIEDGFIFYNNMIGQQVESLMIGLICLVFVVKILQTVQMLYLSQKFTKLLNIFLRVSANEAFNEALLTKQIADSLLDPFDKYLNVDYPDRVLNRKNVVLQMDDESINTNRQTSKKKKKKGQSSSKKFSLHNLRSISKLPIIIYILLSFLLMFAYLFFNYYFAEIITRNQIENLIKVASFFENMFTSPPTMFAMTNIVYYDKISGFPLYTTTKSNFQEYLASTIWTNLKDTERINKNIPQYAYYQSQTMSTDLVSSILNGDSCDTMRRYGHLNDQEYNLCSINFNGAFKKGLVNVISNIQNDLNSQHGYLDISQTINLSKQKQEITNLLSNLGWNNSKSLTSHFYNTAAKIIFEQLNEYYKVQINDQLNLLEKILLSTSILMMILMLILIYVGQRFLRKIYKNITLLLSLIPFEKLINDEQTSFLIKKILRD